MKKKIILVILAATCLAVTAVYGNDMFSAQIENFKIFVNGSEKTFDMPIVTIDGRTYIPLRETAETLDMNVTWDEEKQEININEKNDNADVKSEDELFVYEDTNGKYGYMNAEHEVVIPAQYSNANEFSEGLAAVSIMTDKGLRYGYINNAGENVIPFIYTMARSFCDGLAVISEEEGFDAVEYYYINKQGSKVFDKVFYNAGSFSNGYATYVKKGYGVPSPENSDIWSFINTDGELATELEFEDALGFNDGRAPVEKDGKWGVINTDFELVVDYDYDKINMFKEGKAFVIKDGKCGYIDTNGNVVVDIIYDLGLLQRDFSDGMAVIKSDGKYGYVNLDGKVVIEPQYSYAEKFSDGVAVVKVDGKEGVINKNGEMIIKPEYDSLGSCKNGLIPVYDSEMYKFLYYIDKTSKRVDIK